TVIVRLPALGGVMSTFAVNPAGGAGWFPSASVQTAVHASASASCVVLTATLNEPEPDAGTLTPEPLMLFVASRIWRVPFSQAVTLTVTLTCRPPTADVSLA